MQIFVVVGENTMLSNISARAVFSSQALAQEWIDDPARNYFDDRTAIVELTLDRGAHKSKSATSRNSETQIEGNQ